MTEINPEQYFHTSDGKVVRSLRELPSILAQMSPDAFAHHVNEEKNDFANWIRHVFHKDALADKFEKVTSKQEGIDMVQDALDMRSKKDSYFSKILKSRKFPEDIIAGLRKHWHG